VGNCKWKKTGLWFSPVQSYVYFQSCGLDLQTLGIPAFQRNLNCIQNSTGIILSIWQVPLPKLIPPEFRELPGFWQESVGDSKDLFKSLVRSGFSMLRGLNHNHNWSAFSQKPKRPDQTTKRLQTMVFCSL
jgi:hypothetical protein